MTSPRVAIVAGARTPFVKAGQAFAKLSPLALATHAAYVAELLVETPGLAAAGASKPTTPTTRTTQIAIAVTAKKPDSPDIFLRLIMVGLRLFAGRRNSPTRWRPL